MRVRGKRERHVPIENWSPQEEYLAGVLNTGNKSLPVTGETILSVPVSLRQIRSSPNTFNGIFERLSKVTRLFSTLPKGSSLPIPSWDGFIRNSPWLAAPLIETKRVCLFFFFVNKHGTEEKENVFHQLPRI